MPARCRSLFALVVTLLLAAACAPVAAVASVASVVAAGAVREVPRGVWPLQPRPEVVRRFDPPDSPYGRGHRGVDLLGRPGQAVHSALAGTVSFVGVIAGRGVVAVTHGDLRTTYEPVTATVHVGDGVGEGGVIGRLQPGHSHCRPRQCLHWGLLRGRTYLDPLLLVGAGPVRLLPVAGTRPGGVPTGAVRSPRAAPLERGNFGGGSDQLTVALRAFAPWSWAGT